MQMKHSQSLITCVAMLAIVATTITTSAQVPTEITTPDRVESRLGVLSFKDGVPDDATAQKLFDEIDYVHAFNAVTSGYTFVNQLALLWIQGGRGQRRRYSRDAEPDGIQNVGIHATT